MSRRRWRGRMWDMPNSSPVTAWKALKEGNERFVAGKPEHPSQSIEHRASLAGGQKPTAVVFGCADSRVAAEIIFDQGLGDMFVVRTAGHVIDSAVLGSIEYAVTVLNVPLIVVLGHDSCGAVQGHPVGARRRRGPRRLRARHRGAGDTVDPARPARRADQGRRVRDPACHRDRYPAGRALDGHRRADRSGQVGHRRRRPISWPTVRWCCGANSATSANSTSTPALPRVATRRAGSDDSG